MNGQSGRHATKRGGRSAARLLDPGTHETLDELALEKQKGDQKRGDGEQGAGRDDGEVHA